jgi:hypothetical protein
MWRASVCFGLLFGLIGCANVPENANYGCGARTLSWAFGPSQQLPYIDVCWAELEGKDLVQAFDFVAISGLNPDTNIPIDPDKNGVSGDGQWQNNKIHWGGQGCQQYARRIAQKGCAQFGNSNRSAGCEWIAVQLQPKRNIKQAYVSLTPIWHVRLPDGQETDLPGSTLVPAFKDCH